MGCPGPPQQVLWNDLGLPLKRVLTAWTGKHSQLWGAGCVCVCARARACLCVQSKGILVGLHHWWSGGEGQGAWISF